jgi:hypothetical protein
LFVYDQELFICTDDEEHEEDIVEEKEVEEIVLEKSIREVHVHMLKCQAQGRILRLSFPSTSV